MTGRVRVAASLAAILLVIGVIAFFLPPGERTEGAIVPEPVHVKIGKVSGRVERMRNDETWAPALEGDRIALDERLRTGEDGTAVLTVGEHSTVTLAPGTEASMAKLTESISHVRLQTGRISAVTEKGRSVRIDTGGSDAHIESTGASEFIAMADGLGGLVVASKEGRVRLTASGTSVDVAPGQQSAASGGAPPAQPSAIPSTLFLKILPVASSPKSADTTVTVKTEPGAQVRLNGKTVGIATGATMEVPVRLEPGENRIVIEVEDLSGRILTQEINLTFAPATTEPIDIKTTVTW